MQPTWDHDCNAARACQWAIARLAVQTQHATTAEAFGGKRRAHGVSSDENGGGGGLGSWLQLTPQHATRLSNMESTLEEQQAAQWHTSVGKKGQS